MGGYNSCHLYWLSLTGENFGAPPASHVSFGFLIWSATGWKIIGGSIVLFRGCKLKTNLLLQSMLLLHQISWAFSWSLGTTEESLYRQLIGETSGRFLLLVSSFATHAWASLCKHEPLFLCILVSFNLVCLVLFNGNCVHYLGLNYHPCKACRSSLNSWFYLFVCKLVFVSMLS